MAHITAGAQKVVFSAPAGSDIPTIVYGINEQILSADDNFISAASCSTNALAPMVKALHDTTPILSGHHDGCSRLYRLADAGRQPAEKAAVSGVQEQQHQTSFLRPQVQPRRSAQVIPELAGKLTGLSNPGPRSLRLPDYPDRRCRWQ